MIRQRLLATFFFVHAIAGAFGCGDDDDDKGEMMSPVGSGPDASATRPDASVGTMTDAAARVDATTPRDSAVTPDAAPDAAAPIAAADYTKAENWLCRPDNNAACNVDLTTTVLKADGTTEEEKFTPATEPAFDCFYVYPTVSLDTTDNSDLVPGPEELAVVRAQFARYAQHCRLFAPMYRQLTLTALRAIIAGQPTNPDRTLGYRDVGAAWKHYLAKENNGRPVLLVGHSQGSGVLMSLIQQQIDPDPSKTPLLAAFLIGTNVLVPQGAAVGGSFQKVPVCKTANELGCVVSYVSFRTNAPPPTNSRFGRTMMAGQSVVCANPAALGGGPAELRAYLSKDGAGASGLPMGPWATGKTITTPFVSVPGLLTGECKSDAQGSYLAVTVNGNPADPRTDDIVGDVVTNGQVQADWGLHLIDVHVGMGNLLDLAKAKADAFKAR